MLIYKSEDINALGLGSMPKITCGSPPSIGRWHPGASKQRSAMCRGHHPLAEQRQRHLDVACLLVSQGAEISCKDKRGYTPLHTSASSGQIAVVKHLLNLSVEIDESNAFGNTALHWRDAVVSELIDYGANVSQANNKGFTPLHFAAASTHGALCLEFLSRDGKSPLHMTAVSWTLHSLTDPHPEWRGVHDMFPLHLAALNAHSDCCRKLLSSGFQIDTPDSLGRSCLHAAAAGGNVECVKLLLSSGGDHNKRDKCGRRRVNLEPESEGVQAEREKEAALCLEFLLQSGATASLRDKQGYSSLLDRDDSHQDDPESLNAKSPLHLAAYHGHAQALEVLLQGEREVDQGDEGGRTPLALAALRATQSGASPRLTDSQYGRSAVHLAVMNGHTTCVRLLLDEVDGADLVDSADAQGQEANVNAASKHGLTALHLGLLCGQEECIQCLLEQEASVLIGDSRGRTPIHLAAARGHASWLSELLSIACSEPPVPPPLRDGRGYTPLHWACYYGHEGCVEVLLEQKGCRCIEGNPFTPLHCAVTPLHAAAFSGHVDCVQLILSHDAPVDTVDQSGRSALMMAAEKGRVGALETEDCSLNATNAALQTPLHLAARSGLKKAVQELLSRGANVQTVDENAGTLIECCSVPPLSLLRFPSLFPCLRLSLLFLPSSSSSSSSSPSSSTPPLSPSLSREVADCLALILATMMPFCSPCSSGAPSPGSLLRQLPPQQGSRVRASAPEGHGAPGTPTPDPPARENGERLGGLGDLLTDALPPPSDWR
ncbi:hypothetical protein F7725_002462 [Dissostichus mawsoni]|uniref:Ankyrin repeat domain 44 n=1 Tax=Dissostichus mawsoni TaxID=36200 RepID=A0A7J5Y3G6_DISMA|nr:hypothetical protein F7725_002462 [Dissostichus mawsoni]